MDIIERIRLHIFECEGASCQEMEPDPIPLLLACRDEIIAARACAEMMLQGTGQKLGEELARRVMEQHYPTKWIPVSERLPEVGVSVLAVDYGKVREMAWNGRYWVFPASDWVGDGVTHWQTLPEPPEVK